ncbi:hypothetical protein TNCV_4575711 [Trichonephila clavipes]|nr:hypothetical protein TNCV_4575711 [Trichonephila clavipes]
MCLVSLIIKIESYVVRDSQVGCKLDCKFHLSSMEQNNGSCRWLNSTEPQLSPVVLEYRRVGHQLTGVILIT